MRVTLMEESSGRLGFGMPSCSKDAGRVAGVGYGVEIRSLRTMVNVTPVGFGVSDHANLRLQMQRMRRDRREGHVQHRSSRCLSALR